MVWAAWLEIIVVEIQFEIYTMGSFGQNYVIIMVGPEYTIYADLVQSFTEYI
jgi:hypothetical protein